MHVGRIYKIIAATALAAIAAAAIFMVLRHYALHDPLEGHAPRCMFKLITGYDCPGCGSQRALHAVLNGRFAEAWTANPFVFFAAPLGLFYISLEAVRKRFPQLHVAATNPFLITFFLLATIIFTIIRNL